jgi:hypothetical protein
MGLSRPRTVRVHIERLVLDNVRSSDGPRVAAAVQQELTRLFSQQGVPPSMLGGGAMASVDAGSFRQTPTAKPVATGTQAARSIYRGLTR